MRLFFVSQRIGRTKFDASFEPANFLSYKTTCKPALTLRLLMSYIYMEHLFLMFLDHTKRRTTVGRTPLDE